MVQGRIHKLLQIKVFLVISLQTFPWEKWLKFKENLSA